MTTTSNSANDCILSKPFVYFRRLSRGHSVKVSGSTSDISPLPNSNVPRPFLRPNKIKWRIKGRLRQTSLLVVWPALVSFPDPLPAAILFCREKWVWYLFALFLDHAWVLVTQYLVIITSEVDVCDGARSSEGSGLFFIATERIPIAQKRPT